MYCKCFMRKGFCGEACRCKQGCINQEVQDETKQKQKYEAVKKLLVNWKKEDDKSKALDPWEKE